MVLESAQSKQELLRHLEDSIGFLKASATAFDAGFLGEAKRLATTIRVLAHDTTQSKSLLGLVGYKSGMGFLDTAYDFNPKNLMNHHGLVGLKIGAGESGYWAPLGERIHANQNRYVFFPDWWNKVVIVDSAKAKFCRRDLVLALSNKDGGAHVDPTLDEDYANLTRNNSVGWVSNINGVEGALKNIELHSVRQISYEIAVSIERKLAKLNNA